MPRPPTPGTDRAAVNTLVLPPFETSTAELVGAAAAARDMDVVRLDGDVVPCGLAGRCCLYAARLFGDVVGAQLALGLLEPPADWLASLPRELTARHVDLLSLREAWQLRRPVFVKPADGKSFPARVYPDGTHLPGSDALGPELQVLVSEQLTPLAEYRLFVLDGRVATASRYATAGSLDVLALEDDPLADEVLGFARTVLDAAVLPSAVVVDIGPVRLPGSRGTQWAVVEANAAWSSGVYGCDPDAVLAAVTRSSGPLEAVADPDRAFLRATPSRT